MKTVKDRSSRSMLHSNLYSTSWLLTKALAFNNFVLNQESIGIKQLPIKLEWSDEINQKNPNCCLREAF
jgi:hypothetical protein